MRSQALRAANTGLVAVQGLRVFNEPGWVLCLPGEEAVFGRMGLVSLWLFYG